MTASLETLVVAAYVFATSVPIPRPGPAGKITDAELIALAVAQASMGESSDRKFLGMIAYRLPGWFPHLPDQSQYNRRLRRLVPQITAVQLAVAALVAEGQVRLADGTLISCANYPGCASRSEFAGAASYGYSPSHGRFVWGMRLVVISDLKGVPVGYDLVGPKTGQERESVVELARGQAGSILFCDKGLLGARAQAHARAPRRGAHHPRAPPPRQAPARRGGEGADPARDRVGVRQPEAADAARRSSRQDRRRARAADRPAAAGAHPRSYCNLLAGRPARALVAYDGR